MTSAQGFKIILGTLFFSALFNFQGLSDWANSKEVSSFTILLMKTAEALNQFGQAVALNEPRQKLRTAFTDLKVDTPSGDHPVKAVAHVDEVEGSEGPTSDTTEPVLVTESAEAAPDLDHETSAKVRAPASVRSEDNLANSKRPTKNGAPSPTTAAGDAPLPVVRAEDSGAVSAKSAATAKTASTAKVKADLTKEVATPPTETAPKSAKSNTKVALNNRILLLGDSMLKSGIRVHIKNYFAKKYPQVDIEIDSQSGTGLSRPEVFNWPEHLKEKTGQYDDVVIMLGTNDAQNFQLGKKIIPFGTEAWDEEYSSRVGDLVKLACGKANKVFWVGNIQMRSEKFNAKMQHLQSVAQKALETADCTQYVKAETWVSDGDKYVDHLNVKKKNGIVKNIRVRADDGIHLSFEGAELFANKLIEEVNYVPN